MFKETPVEKLIDYIRALPEEQQRLIAKKISSPKKATKVKPEKKTNKKLRAFADYIEKLPSRLPKNYKFDREEANER